MNRRFVLYALIALITFGIALYISLPTPLAETPRTVNAISSVNIVVDGLETRTLQKTEGTTALALLHTYVQELNLVFREKAYAGMGTLVEQIGEKKNGEDGKYWHYYVNGKLAPVGADSYVIQNGDTIEWKFHTPSEEL